MVRMRFADLVQEVNALLSTEEGAEKIRERREAATKMARGLRRWEEQKGRRLSSRGAVLTATQGALHGVTDELLISVEINGRGVGKLRVPGDGVPLFTPKGTKAEWRWSGDRDHATLINGVLDEYRQLKPVPEREVQGRLTRQLRALFADDKENRPRGGLAPVRPAGCMMEIPTAVAASAALRLGTGTVDVMARTGRGTGSFIACELKEPNARVRVYDVLAQAIRYAAALDIEVNGNDRIGPANFAGYRTLFGATGNAALRFGAMAVVSVRCADDVDDAFGRLAPPAGTWLGVLLYAEKGRRLVAAGPVRRA